MNSQQWARLKEWFGEALDAPELTASILRRAEAESPALAAELRSLLREHELPGFQTGSVLDGARSHDAVADADHLPADIGPYRILRELGRGGGGVVMLAFRRDDEFKRPVALKAQRYFAWDARLREQLTMERRMLSQLQHPNIATLVDWGETGEGVQWIATEFVEGEPIDRYCNSRGLGVKETLGIFRQVGEAVQYAHQRLIVHRDLKPQNVLVTDSGLVKLLDFGISKPLQDVRVTDVVDRRFTPAYASPEQIEGMPVSAATDVYSLGLMLYELLTGTLPFGADSMRQMARRLEDTPPPASHVDGLPKAWQRQIRGDLDRILQHALHRDPNRRYQSVEQFIGDLERFQNGYPILAAKVTVAGRAAKFARRHALPLAAAALAVSAMVVGTVIAINSARVARREQATAERRFKDLQGLAHSVMYELHDSIRQVPQSMEARRLLATTAVKYLDGLAAENIPDESLQMEVAAGYMRMAYAQGGVVGVNVGDTRGSRHSYETALRILEEHTARRPDDTRAMVLKFGAAYNLSLLITNPAEGLAMAEQYAVAAEAFEKQLPMAASSQAIGLMFAAQGRILRNLGRLEDSVRAFARAEAAQRTVIATASKIVTNQPMWTAAVELAQAEFDCGLTNFARAETLLDLQRVEDAHRSVATARSLFDSSASRRTPAGPSDVRMFARVRALQGYVLFKLGDTAAGWKEMETALAAGEANRTDGTATSRRDLAEARRYAGAILRGRGELPAALQQYQFGIDALSELVEADPVLVLNRALLSALLLDHADALHAAGNNQSSIASLNRAIGVLEPTIAEAPTWQSLHTMLAAAKSARSRLQASTTN